MDNQNAYSVKDDVVTVKEWIITMLILLIPVVNIVMTFVWHLEAILSLAKLIILKLASYYG